MINLLMVGPNNKKVNGGMSTVVNNYLESDLSKRLNIKFVPSMIETNMLYKIIYALVAYLKIVIELIFRDYDIIHIHVASNGSFYRKSIIVLLGKLFKKKIVFHIHGGAFDEFYHLECNKLQKKYINYIFNKVDLILVLSKEWKTKILTYSDNKNVKVLHNAVEIPETNLYNSNSNNITLLGRLSEEKGVYDLIEVVNDILKIKNVNFILAGDGDLEKLKTTIKLKNVKSTEVLGWIDSKQKCELLKNTSILVLPSYHEGLPMAILEAMSYGIPVVATNVGGIPSIIKDNYNGFLIKPGDNSNLKECIIKLISNQELRNNFSQNTYKNISKEFSLKSNVDILYTLYKKLLS